MKRTIGCLLTILLLFLLVACDDGRRERLQLEELERQNRADSLMTNDSLALALTNYFDRHGTPNEQLRAYYILGRTYADVGEAPRAIEAYNTAADRADTTAADCDYKTLSRVHAQMSDVYYCQGLYREELKSNQCAIRYGYMAEDTLAALLMYSQRIDTYNMLMKPDSMLYVCETISEQFHQAGRPDLAAGVLCLPIRYLVDKCELSKARQFLETYERESGFFDEAHNIEAGREVYYFYKGYYYLKTCRYDSADYFFRKELATGKDLNNQNAGSYGLALLFQQTHKPDSAAKYALYSYAMNDSVYAHKATDEVAKMTALYNYTRYEREAQQKEQEAERFKTTLSVVCALTVILALLFIIAYVRHRDEKRHLEDRIQLLRGYAVNEHLYNSPIAQRFRELLKANPYQNPDLKDWKELTSLIDREVPSFRVKLQMGERLLSDVEYDVCMLMKIQISSSDIARLKHYTPSNVTHIRERIFKTLFRKKGKADELDEYIMSLT